MKVVFPHSSLPEMYEKAHSTDAHVMKISAPKKKRRSWYFLLVAMSAVCFVASYFLYDQTLVPFRLPSIFLFLLGIACGVLAFHSLGE